TKRLLTLRKAFDADLRTVSTLRFSRSRNTMSSIPIPEPTLSTRAMLCSLSISQWSASKHDRQASEEIAAHHGAQPDVGRYNKLLIPKGNSRGGAQNRR